MVRYLNPANHHPARITKTDKEFAKKLDFENKKFLIKIRDLRIIWEKNSIGISVFVHENIEKHPIYVSKISCEEKHDDLLLIGKEGKGVFYQNVFIKNLNTFMYDHTIRCGRKHFCWYWLQAFNSGVILKSHIKDCFRINGKQRIITPKKGECAIFKYMHILKAF